MTDQSKRDPIVCVTVKVRITSVEKFNFSSGEPRRRGQLAHRGEQGVSLQKRQQAVFLLTDFLISSGNMPTEN